jgi:hypothetical protein
MLWMPEKLLWQRHICSGFLGNCWYVCNWCVIGQPHRVGLAILRPLLLPVHVVNQVGERFDAMVEKKG